MLRSRIAGTGRGTPDKVLTNDDLAKTVATSDEWIRERTGIRERRILEEGRTTSDLASLAGKRACEKAEIDPSEVDCIIVATISPDMPMPAVAVTVQQKIGAGTCAAFDISAACAGFIYGLSIADSFIKTGMFKRVLVIGVEILSRVVDWTDRNTCVLFGDGAGAALLVPYEAKDADDRGIVSTHLYADGAGVPFLNIPGGGSAEPTTLKTVEAKRHLVKMQGKPVFAHAVKNISAAAMTALESNGKTPADIDWVVAHQANLRILENVAQRCGLPMDKFYLNIHKYGNTSSASIPIALDEAMREGKVKQGDLVLMAALGAGLSWGSALVRL
ncbi:MAG: 3-oxoacyl-[acyl-carrier-protein] synthase [Myxococcales bacterium]|nr:3-oxoacyl-[acyl-carrier-protein] synthase [Myxococcales bacterium]